MGEGHRPGRETPVWGSSQMGQEAALQYPSSFLIHEITWLCENALVNKRDYLAWKLETWWACKDGYEVLRPQREGGSAGGSMRPVGAGNGGLQPTPFCLWEYIRAPRALGVFTGGKSEGLTMKLTLQVGVKAR